MPQQQKETIMLKKIVIAAVTLGGLAALASLIASYFRPQD